MHAIFNYYKLSHIVFYRRTVQGDSHFDESARHRIIVFFTYSDDRFLYDSYEIMYGSVDTRVRVFQILH